MIIIGISGPSCCGKTTLARHLRKVIKNSEILYIDDFYKSEEDLPKLSDGSSDWDSPESFDLKQLQLVLQNCISTDALPGRGCTREELNSKSPSLLTAYETAELAAYFNDLLGEEKVLLVEGLFLFHKSSEIGNLIDVKMICPVNYEILKMRRESRKSYQTVDGVWCDPPNYFDDFVWPKFLEYGRFLYSKDFQQVSAEALQQNIWMPTTMNIPLCIREVGLRIQNSMKLSETGLFKDEAINPT